MKKALSLLITALILCTTLSAPVFAAEEPAPGKDSCYYPISVEEYTYGPLDELRIDKVYQLSLDDDPSLIPTEDFERNGRLYYLLDMTRKDEVGVDTKPHVQTVTMPSDTNNMEKILQTLDAEIETVTEDGYTGKLHLDHTTVKVTTDGYATKTGTVSATRTYPNLSDADLSLVPKTISDGGRSLTLADVQWSNSTQEEGDGVVTRYTATARYTGSTSSKYATGYTVTADYSGEVSKTGCNVVTYTAVFGSTETPKDSGVQDGEPVDVSGIWILPQQRNVPYSVDTLQNSSDSKTQPKSILSTTLSNNMLFTSRLLPMSSTMILTLYPVLSWPMNTAMATGRLCLAISESRALYIMFMPLSSKRLGKAADAECPTSSASRSIILP